MLHQTDLSRTDLNLLVLFEVVLQERHVGRAAQRLNLSPSAVSHGLGRLRGQLNDPLFLKTPRGVVPTERALGLAEPIAEILSRVRQVVSSAEPFDPLTSRRRFMIGSPDGSAIAPLPALLAELSAKAPGIDIGTRQIMPDVTRARPWETAFEELDSRGVDLAAVTFGEVPSRFVSRPLYHGDFAVVARKGHPFLENPSLDAYCAANHVMVSARGDLGSYTNDVLTSLGRTRRVQLTVTHFIVALAAIAETDLIGTIPVPVFSAYARRFGLATAPVPFDQGDPSFVHLVAPRAGLMDAGLVWLMETIERLVLESLAP
jgi:DNA-binding transcriptional LysR family regulator